MSHCCAFEIRVLALTVNALAKPPYFELTVSTEASAAFCRTNRPDFTFGPQADADWTLSAKLMRERSI